MSSDLRALRDLLEKTQGRVRELEDELEALEADLREERAISEDLDLALQDAEHKLMPHPGEVREVVKLHAQVHALQLSQATLTETVRRLEAERELLLRNPDARERLALTTEVQQLRARLAALEAAMKDD